MVLSRLLVLLALACVATARGPNGGRNLPSESEINEIGYQRALRSQHRKFSERSPQIGSWDSADPGAIIEMRMNSTVGVVLDNVPQEMRQSLIAYLSAQGTEYWLDRARRQIDLTWYKLVWRMYWTDFEELQIGLPPKSLWNVNLVSTPTVFQDEALFDGHHVLAVDYVFTAYLLTSKESVPDSSAALTERWGSTFMDYVLPVDPDYPLQRLGKACMDEAEFPPGSMDTMNGHSFYDYDCAGVADPDTYVPEAYACHITAPFPSEDCATVVPEVVGTVPTNMYFTRLPFDNDLADSVRIELDQPSDNADIAPQAERVGKNRITYTYMTEGACSIEEGCSGLGWRRLLRFDGTSVNVGSATMHIGRVTSMSGSPDPSPGATDALDMVQNHVYEFSECHQHMHFQHYSTYHYGTGMDCNPFTNLNSVGQACSAADPCSESDTDHSCSLGTKLAWCLESINRELNSERIPLNSPYWLCAYQGITVGWADEYIAGIPCQWVDVTDIELPAGDYPLGFTTNQQGLLCEGDLLRNETGSVMFEPTTPPLLSQKGFQINRPLCNYTKDYQKNDFAVANAKYSPSGSFINDACTSLSHSFERDCGWTEWHPLLTCEAGETVSFNVSAFAKSGSAAADLGLVYRVCESSHVLKQGTACSHLDALAYGQLVHGASVASTFTCPTARADDEPGGLFSLYVAPYVSGVTLGSPANIATGYYVSDGERISFNPTTTTSTTRAPTSTTGSNVQNDAIHVQPLISMVTMLIVSMLSFM